MNNQGQFGARVHADSAARWHSYALQIWRLPLKEETIGIHYVTSARPNVSSTQVVPQGKHVRHVGSALLAELRWVLPPGNGREKQCDTFPFCRACGHH